MWFFDKIFNCFFRSSLENSQNQPIHRNELSESKEFQNFIGYIKNLLNKKFKIKILPIYISSKIHKFFNLKFITPKSLHHMLRTCLRPCVIRNYHTLVCLCGI